ncbi:MAG TPA: (2Fe-2S)-binding protein [Chloroflexota bacterium]|nr:(2Fe-2S)-binding protein [Chloroflexota bacterium]
MAREPVVWHGEFELKLRINGEERVIWAEPDTLLLDAVRSLGLTGARRGCETGYCGACTVHLDGRAVRSCLQLAVRVRGRTVTTIEGLSEPGHLHPLQRAFVERGAMECGYCIPGMIMLAAGLLAEHPRPSPDEVRRTLASNLCRCTGYQKMVQAVLDVAAAS